jgi:hypothetical protein
MTNDSLLKFVEEIDWKNVIAPRSDLQSHMFPISIAERGRFVIEINNEAVDLTFAWNGTLLVDLRILIPPDANGAKILTMHYLPEFLCESRRCLSEMQEDIAACLSQLSD